MPLRKYHGGGRLKMLKKMAKILSGRVRWGLEKADWK